MKTPIQSGGEAMPETKKTIPDSAIVSAMADLQTPLRHLLVMTEILADMLDNYLVEYDMTTLTKRHSPNGKPLKIILSDSDHAHLSFAWNDVVVRAVRLNKAYLAALEGKEMEA